MADIKITCDSASDLPQVLSKRYRIGVLPLGVRMGEDFRYDRVNVNTRELYDYAQHSGEMPQITPVSVEDYCRYFERYTDEGSEVVHVSLSSSLSRCYHNACAAAEQVGGVHVVDSESVSTGLGQLVLLAAELASADYRPEEIVQALDEMKKRLDVSFVLQTPEYLHRSETRGHLAAMGTRLLRLRPEIILSKGAIHHGKPFHGDMETSILDYVRSRIDGKSRIQTDRIFVTHSGVPQSIIEKVFALLRQLQPFEEILEAPAASAVSFRCGPGCLGLSFLRS